MTWKEVIKEMIPYGVLGALIPVSFLTVFFVVLNLLS